VGNVLNSINVSASLAADRIKSSKSARLGEVAALLERNRADLPAFLTRDERGQKLPQYLMALSAQLASEREALLKELTDLRANLDHIKEAVSMQQAYARRCGVLEVVSVVDLVEDSLRMNTGALTRHHVALERDYRFKPDITVDKHKVLQILVNLIRNAKYACDESGNKDKKVIVRIENAPEGTRISVIDNGVGIAPEVMGRLFAHGFTTRKSGHGFGLHSAALAAADLGGSLKATSDGVGRGAAFHLLLPDRPPETARG
jgi:C4-dicarboxylate-specific signal transduction histidine kinase